jgi:hypothetical protein
MRAVVGVGGSCGSTSGYEVAAPCPDGTWLIAIGIPVMIVAMFAGSVSAMSVGAPALLLPMWALLFTTLGWNFLEFGLTDDISVTFIISGILFWAMAAPAWLAMGVAFKRRILGAKQPTESKKVKEERVAASAWSSGSLDGSLWWWLAYGVLFAGGALFGVAVYALAAA